METVNTFTFLCYTFFLGEHLSQFKTVAFRLLKDVDGTQTILAFENEDIEIQCKTGLPMTYCGFLHPKGKRYSFSGRTASDGHCAIRITATKEDDGQWKCHIGRKTDRVETIQNIRLRVVNQVAAIQPNITTIHGKPVTIHCATTHGYVPLSYCRFEPPMGSPFNIDSAVKPEKPLAPLQEYTNRQIRTAMIELQTSRSPTGRYFELSAHTPEDKFVNPILGKYYYPANRSLDRGDCAVTISMVKYDDVGTWTCGAGLDDGNEYTDAVRIEVHGLYTLSTAAATGVTFGVIFIAVPFIIFGVMIWKKRRYPGRRRPEFIMIKDLGQRRSSLPCSVRIVPKAAQSTSEPVTTPLISLNE